MSRRGTPRRRTGNDPALRSLLLASASIVPLSLGRAMAMAPFQVLIRKEQFLVEMLLLLLALALLQLVWIAQSREQEEGRKE